MITDLTKLTGEEFIKRFHELGKPVYAISPELHKNTEPSHPMAGSLDRIKILWADLIKWGVDGNDHHYPQYPHHQDGERDIFFKTGVEFLIWLCVGMNSIPRGVDDKQDRHISH